jgi:YD repeat-containing protein
MPSEGPLTVPPMGSFKRVFLGYRRPDVDAAISARDTRIWTLERDAQDALARWRDAADAAARAEQELTALCGMVIEREREIQGLGELLREANERHDRSIASLEAVSTRLEEIQAQARGQATRIRMKALRDAVEVSRRAQELSDAQPLATDELAPSTNGHLEPELQGLFEGLVKVEIGPLGDFSQLVSFEDAAGQIDATSEISVERFSEGRATISMRLDEPVELLRELEARSPLDFHVRHTAADNLILDIDEDQGPEQRAA